MHRLTISAKVRSSISMSVDNLQYTKKHVQQLQYRLTRQICQSDVSDTSDKLRKGRKNLAENAFIGVCFFLKVPMK